MKYMARDLVMNYDEDAIWKLPAGNHTVTFEGGDGPVKMKREKIIYSHYYWRLHREFPGALIRASHALMGNYSSNTHLDLGAVVLWDVFNGAQKRTKYLIWEISEVFYEITNSIYNATCTRLASYVTTAYLGDFVEVLDDPRVKQAKLDYRQTVVDADYEQEASTLAIEATHKVIKNALYGNDGELKGNPIKKLCKADIVSKGQMLQLFGPRGFVHDIDNRVFKYPIDNGYIEGLGAAYDSATESRSAARALYMNNKPLQQSEYFNREMQLLCSGVHSVKGESCRGFATVPYYVAEGDLQLLKGKYHMVDGKPVMIWDTIDHLVDQWIQLRSITGCGNHDTQTVCKTCLGFAATVMQPGTNVGYALSTILCAIVSQLVLSTKHFEASVGSMYLELTKDMLQYIRTTRADRSKLYLTKQVASRNPIIRIPVESARQLNQILNVDVEELPPSRITNCPVVYIVETDKQGAPMGAFEELKLELGGTGSFLTTEVLKYLKENSWAGDGTNYIEFQLKGWDYTQPVFGTPRRGDNIHLFLQEVKSFVMPLKASESRITDYRSRGKALAEFVILLRKRLNFNITQAEIFIRACMTIDGPNKNYNLPKAKDDFVFMSAKNCLYNRNLSALLAYQEQGNAIIDPNWFLSGTRMQHMMDDILTRDTGN